MLWEQYNKPPPPLAGVCYLTYMGPYGMKVSAFPTAPARPVRPIRCV